MTRCALLEACKRELLELYKGAIESVKPNSIINESIRFENNILLVKSKDSLKFDVENSNLHVIGAGKSVLGMALGIANVVANSEVNNKLFSHGCLSLPRGLKRSCEQNKDTQRLLESIGTKVYFGSGNNLPCEESVIATEKILESIGEACEFDKKQSRRTLFLLLLSGGGSSCLTKPKYISLEKKLKLIQYLVEKGASIIELNKVRRFFSNVKGGQLAKFILKSNPEARIVSLILSDVVGDPIDYIASGPTVLNSSVKENKKQMLDILFKYSYPEKLSFLDEDDVSDHTFMVQVGEKSITNCIIGNNVRALNSIEENAKKIGYTVECIGNELNGETEDIVARLIEFGDKRLSELECKKILIIGGGEGTISKLSGETWGLGGRLQEMAMDYMILKTIRPYANQNLDTFLGCSSDGQDGPTDVGACFASHYEWNKEEPKAFSLEELKSAKAKHNSYDFWTTKKPDWLIKTGLTGTNVMDLYMYSVVKV